MPAARGVRFSAAFVKVSFLFRGQFAVLFGDADEFGPAPHYFERQCEEGGDQCSHNRSFVDGLLARSPTEREIFFCDTHEVLDHRRPCNQVHPVLRRAIGFVNSRHFHEFFHAGFAFAPDFVGGFLDLRADLTPQHAVALLLAYERIEYLERVARGLLRSHYDGILPFGDSGTATATDDDGRECQRHEQRSH